MVRKKFNIIASGALLIALVLTLVSDQRIGSRRITLTGGGKTIQIRLVELLLLAYTVTATAAVILGRLAAMDRIPFTHLELAPVHDYGFVWALGLAGLLFIILPLILATRSITVNETRT